MAQDDSTIKYKKEPVIDPGEVPAVISRSEQKRTENPHPRLARDREDHHGGILGLSAGRIRSGCDDAFSLGRSPSSGGVAGLGAFGD